MVNAPFQTMQSERKVGARPTAEFGIAVGRLCG